MSDKEINKEISKINVNEIDQQQKKLKQERITQLKVEVFDIIMQQEFLNSQINQLQNLKLQKLQELQELQRLEG